MQSIRNTLRSSLAEEATVFSCVDSQLVGILHHAEKPARLGVLIVTGGPQYRIGSHRQLLVLARAFAAAGFPTFRFDHRGSGDSEGSFRSFEQIGDDIAAAIEAFLKHSPDLQRIALWGLCDAASAILLNAPSDRRVAGLVLVNPWVRSPESEARAMVRHYYGRRLFDRVFWRRLLTGKVAIGAALSGFGTSLASWLRARSDLGQDPAARSGPSLSARMAWGLASAEGPVGLIISGRDLTAREFEDAAVEAPWRDLLADRRVTRHDLPTADHTFSRRVWRQEVITWTITWLRRLEPIGQRLDD
jgi:exosortase A-associated hydrolase 1